MCIYVRRLDSFEKKSTRNCLFISLVFEKMEYLVLLQNGLVVLFTIAISWKLITYMWGSLKMEKEPMKVLVTGAAGQIGYAIAPMIARGIMLGPDQPVILHLLDIAPAAEALNGVKMELLDAAFPLLKEVHATTDVTEACKDVNIAIMLGGFPRKEGMERKDMMSKNVPIYKEQASALEEHAASDCKVLVVANPANTNALILKEFAPSIPKENITCLTRLDHNRALSQIAERLKVYVTDVKNVIIWGNHSSTQYPDANHAIVTTTNGERLVKELDIDDHCSVAQPLSRLGKHQVHCLLQVLLVIICMIGFSGLPRERGFPWECILMVLMGSQRILFTLFLLNVRKENGQL
ncbi:malate dehydrogenase, cytoplasmic-like isoform X2 [Quercus lobata]|uniref:malate dehydrogenase, cytoplasmic-like isoform X2 n=1 Tax=Quercus lobata TaxID=97700 RepID=UPI0012463499|nr:malate dehydrogenase, cytoplasmic-like isoform X2 [Quercus lobata]